MNPEKKTSHFGLLPLFTLVMFLALVLNAAVSALFVFLLIRGGILSVSGEFSHVAWRLILIHVAVSLPIGLLISFAAVTVLLRPVRNLIDSMDRLASGDFKTRVSVGSVMRRYPTFVAAADSFNKMAEQLESTELLRSDFINNFSHEFKTPIVSIAGFAKLLLRGNLPAEQQKEYLRIIEEESRRLSYMATNVLNLTKVENQTILTDVSEYNLSEQLRSCILLLERDWESKDLELQLDFGEYTVRANEELLKQVWINLLDNAIKFAPVGHTVRVGIGRTAAGLGVVIMNTGSQIPAEKQEKIFNKFYQADESHVTKGNGVGLAIVKRIVELHGGTVKVSSENEVTAFTVELPQGS